MGEINNLKGLKKALTNNPQLQQEFKDDPLKALSQIESTLPDNWVYRLVVGALGLAIILVIVGIVILSLNLEEAIDPTVSTLFTAIASGAVGALAGLLAPTPRN